MGIPEEEIIRLVKEAKVTVATEVEGGTVVEAESEGFSAPAESPAEGAVEGEGLESAPPAEGGADIPAAAIEIFVPGAVPDTFPEGEPLVGEQQPAEEPPTAGANEEALGAILGAPPSRR